MNTNRVWEMVEEICGSADSEELKAMKDEILSNCEARYIDMVEGGIPEADALAEIRRSLQGMEEEAARFAGTEIDRNSPLQNLCEDGYTGIDTIEVNTTSCDVMIEASGNDRTCIEAEGESEFCHMVVERSGNRVTVREELQWKRGILGVFRSNGLDRIIIRLPAAMESVTVRTVSGDIRADLKLDPSCRVSLQTTSGDVDARGCTGAMKTVTISGDVEMKVDAPAVTVKTTSGDIRLAADSVCREVDIASTSGDVELELQGELCWAGREKTISGEIRNRACTGSTPLNGKITTVSGDIRIGR